MPVASSGPSQPPASEFLTGDEIAHYAKHATSLPLPAALKADICAAEFTDDPNLFNAVHGAIVRYENWLLSQAPAHMPSGETMTDIYNPPEKPRKRIGWAVLKAVSPWDVSPSMLRGRYGGWGS